jgi:hypothetical protein
MNSNSVSLFYSKAVRRAMLGYRRGLLRAAWPQLLDERGKSLSIFLDMASSPLAR